MARRPLFRDPNNATGRTSAPVGKGVSLTRSHRLAKPSGVILSWGLLITITCLTPPIDLGQSSTNQDSPTAWDTRPSPLHTHHALSTSSDDIPQALADKRKAFLKANFEKTKNDAAEMAALAKELRTELDKPDPDAHSLQVANLAEKIEKLAKKIRGEMEGF